MTSEKGRSLHGQASEAQEKGDYLIALKLEDEAMVAYQVDNDGAGFAEILAMRLLTLNMMGDKTSDKRYYILASHEANASLDLAELAGEKQQIALAHGALGRALDRAEKFEAAADHFDQTVTILSQTEGGHNRRAVIADFKNHAATSRLAAGKPDQEQVALEALKELEKAGDATEHELGVWKSGGYMRLALGMFKNSKSEEAKKYLDIAETVVRGSEDQKVRLEQIMTMRQKFGL